MSSRHPRRGPKILPPFCPALPYRTNGAVTALYSSFTVRFIGLPNNAGTYFAHFTGETLSLHRARVWASTTNIAASAAAASGHFLLGIGNSSAGNASSGQWLTELATNVTYTVVTRYQIATATSTLWISPSAEGDTSVTATDFVDPTNFVNVVYYAFRQASGEGTIRIDNLKVGTSFNDVAGANTSPTISAISPQSIAQGGSAGPVDFTVGDAETAAGALTLSAGSSNPALIPTNNISFGGAGATRTVTVNPIAGQQGSATITITVSDGVNETSTSFLF